MKEMYSMFLKMEKAQGKEDNDDESADNDNKNLVTDREEATSTVLNQPGPINAGPNNMMPFIQA